MKPSLFKIFENFSKTRKSFKIFEKKFKQKFPEKSSETKKMNFQIFRNEIKVVDLAALKVVKTMVAHPRRESRIRIMSQNGLGVWVRVQLLNFLRTFFISFIFFIESFISYYNNPIAQLFKFE